MSRPLPPRITLETLAERPRPLPEVELHALDMGWYIVRFHHADFSSVLVDATGETKRFSGTQWVSRALAPLGFTHGVLTWADATDEMIGTQVAPVSAHARMEQGVRVAFATR